MDFLEKILTEKSREVAQMPLEPIGPLRQVTCFTDQVKANPSEIQVIGEVKRASPSKGAIKLDVDVVAQAQSYEAASVSAISVLTDPVFFKGTIADLHAVAQAVTIPVLCKDFIIDQKQLIRARNNGATMVLLIVAALSKTKLAELYRQAQELDLEVLVEVHDAAELQTAEQLGAPLIGVNNRNLKTFEVTLDTSIALGQLQQTEAVYISESGIRGAADVEQLKDRYAGILVGEALMRDQEPQKAAARLRVAR